MVATLTASYYYYYSAVWLLCCAISPTSTPYAGGYHILFSSSFVFCLFLFEKFFLPNRMCKLCLSHVCVSFTLTRFFYPSTSSTSSTTSTTGVRADSSILERYVQAHETTPHRNTTTAVHIVSLLGLKNRHGHWLLCWMSIGIISRKNGVTLLEQRSRFGDNPVKFQVFCPHNGTAVLRRTHTLVFTGDPS